jgi:hypothetical protein
MASVLRSIRRSRDAQYSNSARLTKVAIVCRTSIIAGIPFPRTLENDPIVQADKTHTFFHLLNLEFNPVAHFGIRDENAVERGTLRPPPRWCLCPQAKGRLAAALPKSHLIGFLGSHGKLDSPAFPTPRQQSDHEQPTSEQRQRRRKRGWIQPKFECRLTAVV